MIESLWDSARVILVGPRWAGASQTAHRWRTAMFTPLSKSEALEAADIEAA